MTSSSGLERLCRPALRVLALAAVPAVLLAQNSVTQNAPTTGNKPFVNADKDTSRYDKRDFSGFWARNPAQFGQTACPECRDPGPFSRMIGAPPGLYGFFGDVPPMTPEGEKRFQMNKPTKGLLIGSKQASEDMELHVAYRRAVTSSETNNPEERCEPLGLMRLITYSGGNPPMQIVQTNGIIVQKFEWSWDHREIWLDGRGLPRVEDYLPRFTGFSVGKWEGDTLVVTTVGFDDRQWVDGFGFPVSVKAVLEERYSRPSGNRLRLDMTLTDPVNYTRPWQSSTKVWGLVPKKAMSLGGWSGLVEDRCVQADNNYYRSFEPAGSKIGN